MLLRPAPPRGSRPKPLPSSATTTRNSSPAESTTETAVACACLATLVRASRRTASTASVIGPRRGAIDWAGDGDLWVEAENRTELADEVEHLRVQAFAVDGELDVEDRLAELANGLVDAVDGLTDPRRCFGPFDQARGPLKRQPDGKEPLDHGIVEIAGDAIAVLHQSVLPNERVKSSVLYGDARGDGQSDRELLVGFGERIRRRLVGQVEVPVDVTVNPYRDPEE